MEYYPGIKRKEILSFAATWLNLEDISQVRHNKQIPFDLIYMCNQKQKELN